MGYPCCIQNSYCMYKTEYPNGRCLNKNHCVYKRNIGGGSGLTLIDVVGSGASGYSDPSKHKEIFKREWDFY